MKHLARSLRKNMTEAEKTLWYFLRNRRLKGYKFRRQKPIGKFIVDFVCTAPKLIVEVDGGQHAVNTGHDARRTAYLQQKGYRVLRFWNHDVLREKEVVLKKILAELRTPSPRPSPPLGERETDTQRPKQIRRGGMMPLALSPGRGKGQGEGLPV